MLGLNFIKTEQKSEIYSAPVVPWWRHQMKYFPRHWPLCGEFTGTGEYPAQRPVTRSFDVFCDLRLNKRLSKQPWGWWIETPPWSLWCHCNAHLTNSCKYRWTSYLFQINNIYKLFLLSRYAYLSPHLPEYYSWRRHTKIQYFPNTMRTFVFCYVFLLVSLPISFRITSLALVQRNQWLPAVSLKTPWIIHGT